MKLTELFESLDLIGMVYVSTSGSHVTIKGETGTEVVIYDWGEIKVYRGKGEEPELTLELELDTLW